jgi:hypothetical protein
MEAKGFEGDRITGDVKMAVGSTRRDSNERRWFKGWQPIPLRLLRNGK